MVAQNYIDRLCRRIVDLFRPQKVILFGSYAYGSPSIGSDIDLLVVMPFDGHPHAQTARIRGALDSEMPLDLLVRTPEFVRERIEMEDFFMREIVEQGRVLYEADHG